LLLPDHGDSPQVKPNEPEPPITSPESAWNKDRIKQLSKEIKEIANILRSCIPYIDEMEKSLSAQPEQQGVNTQPCDDLLQAYKPPGLNYSQSSPGQNSSWPSILDPMSKNCQKAKLVFPTGAAQVCKDGMVLACKESVQRSYQSWYAMGTRQCYEGMQRSQTTASPSGYNVTKPAIHSSSTRKQASFDNYIAAPIFLLAWIVSSACVFDSWLL
jgi:hypothetical protein